MRIGADVSMTTQKLNHEDHEGHEDRRVACFVV